jgi:hypothetical protein
MSIVTVMIYYEEHAAAEAISRCYDHHERSLLDTFGVGVCRAVMPRVLVTSGKIQVAIKCYKPLQTAT